MSYLFKEIPTGTATKLKELLLRKLITEFGKSDAVSLINTLIDTFQCYVMADNKKVIFMDEAHFKTVTEEQFRWLYNTDDINLSLDKTNLRTKCWVYPYKDAHDNYFSNRMFIRPSMLQDSVTHSRSRWI